jgi:signal peptide peptidase SppA
MNYPHIAARALNRPLLLEPGYARIFFAAVGPRLGVAALTDVQGFTTPAAGLPAQAASYNVRAAAYRGDKSYALINGIAVIPVEGTLVHKSGYVGSSSGVMGYDGLEAQIKSAIADPDVRGIMLDVDSPGGEVAGVQELGRVISNSTKPVWAHANEQSASAAYWLTSAADRILLTESAEVGSIGVLMAHGDYSRALENEGIKVTLIFSGAHKVDGNPYEALPEAVLAEFQADLDQLRGVFTATVAGNRGIPTSQVLATEARMYRGQAAVDKGLADAVMSFDDAMATFSETLAKKGVFTKGKSMSKTSDTSASPNAGEGVTAEAHATGVAAARTEGHAAGLAEGTTAGTAAGATAERARISAILTHDNATGREATARQFALSTDMSADTAIAVLATVPKSTHAADVTLGQMASTQHVGSESEGAGKGNSLVQQFKPTKG